MDKDVCERGAAHSDNYRIAIGDSINKSEQKIPSS